MPARGRQRHRQAPIAGRDALAPLPQVVRRRAGERRTRGAARGMLVLAAVESNAPAERRHRAVVVVVMVEGANWRKH